MCYIFFERKNVAIENDINKHIATPHSAFVLATNMQPNAINVATVYIIENVM